MASKNKIPGDILRVMRNVDKQPMKVDISGIVVDMSRKQFDELMKCIVFQFNRKNQPEGDVPPDGFYLVDTKTKTATFKWLAIIKPSATSLDVNGRIFKVNQPWKDFTYA